MGEKIIVGPVNRGLKNDRRPFVIDNDSFPFLINAYQWRGRVKRKRGTSFLNRLTRFFNSNDVSYTPGGSVPYTILLDGTGTGNLFTGPYTNTDIPPKTFTLQQNGNIVPGSVILVASGGPTTYTDPTKDGFLTPTGTGGPNTIDYASGTIVIPAQADNTIRAQFLYFPDLPVMGLEDFISISTQFPGTIAFDTTYSYNISTASPYFIYDVSFYKNPPASASLPAYIQKTSVTPTTWNGQDYQQFWTVNYQGAMWTTNGFNTPFSTANIGMQFAPSATITYVSNTATTITLTITNCPLVVGDFVFLNEFVATTPANSITLNFQSGYVITTTGSFASLTVTIELPFAAVAVDTYTPGIVQYLTNRSTTTVDSLRWYDGDPTNGSATNPMLTGNLGWVNFAPPLVFGGNPTFSIADLPFGQYYLVGARLIIPFKDRLLFVGPVIQTSAANSQVYLQDTVIYSQNGTPYYTASFKGDPRAATTVFTPILVPRNQTATASAYFEDNTGFGGFISAGIDQPILTASPNEDVLILGFSTVQTRLIYSGNDIVPFNFFVTNSELGSASTFSAITMDEGVISRGTRGFIVTSQVQAQRIDLDIPDEVFEISLISNGNERFCAQRDFINEWIYFTYPVNGIPYIYPNQTLQYNYRDQSWAIFYECYTTYGTFRKQTGFTWATVGLTYPTWNDWNEPWNAGISTLLQPTVIAGNQQGFIVTRDAGTNEATSLYIQNIVGSTVTSPNHCLNEGDYIIITGAIGSVGSQVNSQIFSVGITTTNNFVLNPPLSSGLTYSGGGLITRMYLPFIQTKQFPPSWGIGRKTRLGPQQYLFTATDISQITLLIYLSQNGDFPYNIGPIVPSNASINSSLVYNTILYTCPESTNLGLTPANINLNMVTAQDQEEIWHRMNTSLIGDTVQVGFTMSDTQMRSLTPTGNTFAITGASQTNPCVLTTTGNFTPGQLIQISGILGMTQLNFNSILNNNYVVISSNSTTTTINVDATGFTAYMSGGSAFVVAPINQFAEIELHGFILNVSPSMVLA